jgi:hypothetical protein
MTGATTRVAAQMDALALWPDGSVKLASIAVQLPVICASSQIAAMLSKTGSVNTSQVAMPANKTSLTVNLAFTSGSYTGTIPVDLGAAFQSRLQQPTPDYWLRGPLVTQARVDVPLNNPAVASTRTLHITTDVSVFADGTSTADVQFNNDYVYPIATAAAAPLPALTYTATINFLGNVTARTVTQNQYTNWHVVVRSNAVNDLNVQHDVAQLRASGAILPYDLTTGVNAATLQSYDINILQAAGFGLPLATNGVAPYMPNTGGRLDIGYTTQWNTTWLITQDQRAAKVAMAQSDTSGAVPWNRKLASSGHWLTPAETGTLRVWTDSRGGSAANTTGVANLENNASSSAHLPGAVWTPDADHQPNLNYVPYIMTGARWNLDRLHAQAAFGLVSTWTDERCIGTSGRCNIVLNGKSQVRHQAWSFRELLQAAFVARPGTSEYSIYTQAVADNWTYQRSQWPVWAAAQGQAAGWMPGVYGSDDGATAEWQQDFLTGVAAMAALMGDTNGRDFITWQKPWLSGRFSYANSMNPYDGCTYNLNVYNAATGLYYNTWAAIEAATIAAGRSNGTDGSFSKVTGQNAGYFCGLARAGLNAALRVLPGDAALISAWSTYQAITGPAAAILYIDQANYRGDPTYNIVE